MRASSRLPLVDCRAARAIAIPHGLYRALHLLLATSLLLCPVSKCFCMYRLVLMPAAMAMSK
jgi:hypothetical protein